MLRAVRNFPRACRVGWLLLRYDILSVARAIPALEGRVPTLPLVGRLAKYPERQPAENLKAALIALGPSYIKLGQVISTRVDLLGQEIADTLAELQDGLDGFGGEVAMQVITRSLDKPLDQLFSEFDPVPVSAASVAQVHKAITTDGRLVAVKVLRPGIAAQFKRELELLDWLAGLAERIQPRLNPRGIIEVYTQQITFETDLRLEASQADEFYRQHQDDPLYKVPKIDWQRTAKDVLVMDWVVGTSIDDKAALLAKGLSMDEVMRVAATAFFKSVFEHGYFHGDQHGGNMFITDDCQVMFVDFGIMGRLNWAKRKFLADIMHALIARDYSRLARVYAGGGYLPNHVEPEQFATALRAFAEPIIDQPLENVSFGRLLGQLLAMGEAFGMEAQPDLFLLQKNMLMAEGISRQIAPHLNIFTLAEPLIAEWMVKHRSLPAQVAEELQRSVEAVQRLPGLLAKTEAAVDQINRNDQGAWSKPWLWLAVASILALGLALS